MDAQVGDRVVVEANKVGAAARTGTVIEVFGAHAGGLYRVRWDDGHESVVSPGSDARFEHDTGSEGSGEPRRAVTSVELRFEEDEDHTDAWATLRTPSGTITAHGEARRNPEDPNVPLVGEELAAARALIALGDQLQRAAGEAIEHKEQPEGHLVG